MDHNELGGQGEGISVTYSDGKTVFSTLQPFSGSLLCRN